MPLDSSVKKFLELLKTGGPARGELDIAARRENFRGLLSLAGGRSPAAIACRDDVIPGPGGALRLRTYSPPATTEPGPALLFLHGGGFITGDLDTHDGVCRVLAQASGCHIIAADYRLAPEHPFPAAIDDGLAALLELKANPARWNIDASRLAIGGDSIGGNLAAVICQEWRSLGHPPLAAQFLICPVLDAVGDLPSRRLFAQGYYIESNMIADDFSFYCPTDVDRRDPRLSPIRQTDFSGLPAAVIHIAEYDPFRDEGVRYGELLRGADVPVMITRHQGMIHLFYAFARLIPPGGEALAAMGRELGDVLSGCRSA